MLTEQEKMDVAEMIEGDWIEYTGCLDTGLSAPRVDEQVALAKCALDQAGLDAAGQRELNLLLRRHLLGEW